MLQEYRQRIQNAKQRPYRALNMFNIGDIVYPFFAHNLVNWGTVVDINPVTRKVTVNFNGVNRQFDPQWLIKTNPQIKLASMNKSKVANNYHKMVLSLYYKQAPSIYKMSQNQNESGQIHCPTCKQPLQVCYNAQNKQVTLTCQNCGRSINRSKIASMEKHASRIGDLMISFEQFAEKYPQKEIRKQDIQEQYLKYFREYRLIVKQFLDDIISVLKSKGIKVI